VRDPTAIGSRSDYRTGGFMFRNSKSDVLQSGLEGGRVSPPRPFLGAGMCEEEAIGHSPQEKRMSEPDSTGERSWRNHSPIGL